jgi:hypothetical protein
MSDMAMVLAVLAGWILLQHVVLPWLGVPT